VLAGVVDGVGLTIVNLIRRHQSNADVKMIAIAELVNDKRPRRKSTPS
jgi:hypothetical protein